MLPIHAVLDELKDALRARNVAVLVAPPGAGKTTVVPLALLDAPWRSDGRILMLEPRRLAARAAAARMAQTLGEPVGETVGFRVRLQSKVSARTRIEVVTEGVFTRMLLDDPTLDGVAAVIFDEFHERSLDADLGLALARDSQTLLRDDLRILVMSATLDGARISALLGDAPIVESQGRAFPVETRYLGRDPRERIEDQAARAVARALASETGSLLVFLPGQGEIRRTAERLAERITDPAVDIAPLYGALDPAEQDRAIAPAAPGRRKVVLATSIAETSLTIEGVRGVIDCGLARVPRYDPAGGLTRLETVRVSRAAADQRRGRAGRTEPGVCWRLWDEPETRSLAPFARPEILEADLAGLALDLAAWGAKDASGLAFLDPPPAGAFTEARRLLTGLQALDADGALTPDGKAIARLPLPPRLAHMVLRGAASGQAERAARIAAVLTEQGLGGKDADLRHRLDRLRSEKGGRARDAQSLIERWTRAAGAPGRGSKLSDGLLLAEAYPERVARQRGGVGEYRLANGRGVFIEPGDALAREPWLAVADLGGGAARDRILLAAPLDETELRAAFADRMVKEQVLEADAKGRLKALSRVKLGEIVVEERVVEKPNPELIADALLNQVRREGLGSLPWGERAEALRARAAFFRAADTTALDLSDEALLAGLDDWLAPLLTGRSSLSQLTDADLTDALRAVVPWDAIQRLDREVPSSWTAPTGTGCRIDYAAEGGPRVEVRAQELFGLDAHPTVAGVPLTLALLSPARRPIQVTKDLPGFWRGSWKAVRADLRGRYPRHPWPENPLEAPPTTRAKPRGT